MHDDGFFDDVVAHTYDQDQGGADPELVRVTTETLSQLAQELPHPAPDPGVRDRDRANCASALTSGSQGKRHRAIQGHGGRTAQKAKRRRD